VKSSASGDEKNDESSRAEGGAIGQIFGHEKDGLSRDPCASVLSSRQGCPTPSGDREEWSGGADLLRVEGQLLIYIPSTNNPRQWRQGDSGADSDRAALGKPHRECTTHGADVINHEDHLL